MVIENPIPSWSIARNRNRPRVRPLMAFAAPLLIAVVLKLGLPFAAAMLREALGFDLTVHYAFIVSLALTLVPMMKGSTCSRPPRSRACRWPGRTARPSWSTIWGW